MKTNHIVLFIIILENIAFLSSHAQQVILKDGYVAISTEGLSQGMREDMSTIYEKVPLGSLSNPQLVYRVKRQLQGADVNKLISPLFAIAPTNINKSGQSDNTAKMTWAEAGGWGENANTTLGDTPQYALETGCPQYKGKDGNDTAGSWRLPNLREIHLINRLMIGINAVAVQIDGFQDFGKQPYWSVIELSAPYGLGIILPADVNHGQYKKSDQLSVRCIKDLPAK